MILMSVFDWLRLITSTEALMQITEQTLSNAKIQYHVYVCGVTADIFLLPLPSCWLLDRPN